MSPELHERITAAAKAQNRSINAEINARLEATFLEGTLGRLHWLFEQMRDLLGPSTFSASILAEGIGEETPSRLDRVLSGLEEPTFKMLDAIAAYCCANAQWLKHGTGSPFNTVSPMANYGAEFCSELMAQPLSALHIVGAKTPEGQISIVKQTTEKDFFIYRTTIHLSDVIGATGHSHQIQFLETCITLSQKCVHVVGYLVDFEFFLEISHGEKHPLLLLKGSPRSFWADEWWDFDYLDRAGEMKEPWEGFNTLVKRLRSEQGGLGLVNRLDSQID
jgi:hypothetical protein